MNFSRYMREWLYGRDGYYSKYRSIGKEGDFYTAVSASGFFGASIANHFMRCLRDTGVTDDIWLIEIGAHRGYLLADMIEWIYSCDPELVSKVNFATIERHEDLRKVQTDYFYERFGNDIRLVQFASLEEIDVSYAFFVSNEILDAFECELYNMGKQAIVMNGEIEWIDAEKALVNFAEKYGIQRGEIAVGYEEFAEKISKSADRFDFVTFDYGEKYPRNDFSIRIYRDHRTYPLFDEEVDLSGMFKTSDITYDVNFAHAIDAFVSAGASVQAYETQARALVRFGIIDILEQYMKVADNTQYAYQSERVKTLLAPTIMGDRFKLLHTACR